MLAAIAAVAIAIIGIVAVYQDASHTSRDTEAHRTAVELAEEMAAKIRQYHGKEAGFASSIGVVCDKSSAQSRDIRDTTANEAACWQDEVEKHLQNGLGTITLDGTTRTYTVIVSWNEPGLGSAS